jgi:tripartite-type tricarboxylate transporter receptor subunit TctC
LLSLEALKDVPTLSELGYDSVDGTIWFGIVAPAGTPREAILRLHGDIGQALRVTAVREKFTAQSLYPVEVTSEEFVAFLAGQTLKYGRIIKDAGIKAN